MPYPVSHKISQLRTGLSLRTMLGVCLVLLSLPSMGIAQEVEFFGDTFAGDAFVWCVDGSQSMAIDNRWETVRTELELALTSLDASQEFNITVYNTIVGQFSLSPVLATDANKLEAFDWLALLNPVSTTCMTNSILVSLTQLEMTNNTDRVMFLVGDGPPACIGENATSVINATAIANELNSPIHCLLLADTPEGVDLFQSIAMESNGTFRNLDNPGQLFRRGDADNDGNFIGLLDALFILRYQFVAGSDAPVCFDAADADDDGAIVGLLDGLYLLNFQFVTGSPPIPAPGQTLCGADPTSDPLECEVSSCP